MSIDSSKAFDVREEGFVVTDDDGNTLFYMATGNGSPVGIDAPINTWYFRTDTQQPYIKYGIGLNDWSLFSSETEFIFREWSNGSLPIVPDEFYGLDGGDLDCLYTASSRIDGGNL